MTRDQMGERAREIDDILDNAFEELRALVTDATNSLIVGNVPMFCRELPDNHTLLWNGSELCVVSPGGTISRPLTSAPAKHRLAAIKLIAEVP